MKHLILPFLFVVCTHFADAQKADAQNNDWFRGSWYGIKSFTGARIGIKVLVRIEVDSVYRNRFSGHFIYMYPKDTIARLTRTFSGNIKGNIISLDKSKEIELLDPRSRSFWSNCSQCNETASLSLSDSDLVFKITTTNCGDSCNGETVFSRKVYDYDPSMQTSIKKLFTKDKSPVTAKSNSKQKNKNSKVAKKNLADTIKKDQPLTGLNNKQAINKKDSVAKTGQSTQTFKVANKDSLQQAIANREKPETVKINPVQKNNNSKAAKNSLTDTMKNDQSLTKLNNEKSVTTTDSTSKTIDSTHSVEVINTDPLPQAMINRETQLINTYQVDSPHVKVELYDNGEIDSDIVSVFYNGKLIISHLTLGYKPIEFTIDASATNRHHEFVMIAENEGSIPPNTALLIIKAGGKRYKLSVSTSGTKNAKIAIDYMGD